MDVLEQDRNCTNRRGTSNTGNLLIVGNKGNGKTVLAVDVVKAIQKQRKIRQGRVAIITGEALNKKKISDIIAKLYGGALIIEKAGKLSERTVAKLNKAMEKENLIVRRFVPESWRDGSIIHDFMHEIGMDVTSEFQELEENVNLRLDKNTTEIKRILNQESEFSEKEISYMGKYLKEISKTYIEKDTTEMLSKEELQQFLKK